VHFGLGGAPTVDELVIHWPSGCVQTLHDIASHQVLEVVERCPPIADAGADQTRNEGSMVTLDGTGSRNAITYTWTQLSGPPIILSDPTSP